MNVKTLNQSVSLYQSNHLKHSIMKRKSNAFLQQSMGGKAVGAGIGVSYTLANYDSLESTDRVHELPNIKEFKFGKKRSITNLLGFGKDPTSKKNEELNAAENQEDEFKDEQRFSKAKVFNYFPNIATNKKQSSNQENLTSKLTTTTTSTSTKKSKSNTASTVTTPAISTVTVTTTTSPTIYTNTNNPSGQKSPPQQNVTSYRMPKISPTTKDNLLSLAVKQKLSSPTGSTNSFFPQLIRSKQAQSLTPENNHKIQYLDEKDNIFFIQSISYLKPKSNTLF